VRRPRPLTVALMVSIALHFGVLVTPAWNPLEKSDPAGEALRLEAKLSAPPAPAAKAVAAGSKPKVKPVPRPKPAVLPPDAPTAQLPVDEVDANVPEAQASAPASVDASAPALADASAPASADASVPLADQSLLQIPVAQRLPRQGLVRYRGSAGSFLSIPAYGQARWEHDGEHFQSQLSAGLTDPDSTLDFRSTGRLIGSQIVSETTRDNRRGKLSTGLIDQVAGKVTMQRGADTRERQIKGLAVAISALPQLLVTLDESVEKAAFFIVGDFWVEDSVLIFRGKERLELPAGQVDVRHYVSRTNNGSVIEIWLAPAWRNAPARIRIKLGSITIDLKAVEVVIEGQKLAHEPEP